MIKISIGGNLLKANLIFSSIFFKEKSKHIISIIWLEYELEFNFLNNEFNLILSLPNKNKFAPKPANSVANSAPKPPVDPDMIIFLF